MEKYFAVYSSKRFETPSFSKTGELQAKPLYIKLLFCYEVSSLNEETTNAASELANRRSLGVTQRFRPGSVETVVGKLVTPQNQSL
jgi:hypothetical protein